MYCAWFSDYTCSANENYCVAITPVAKRWAKLYFMDEKGSWVKLQCFKTTKIKKCVHWLRFWIDAWFNSFSYPAIVVIPSKVADDMILKVAKNHKLNRFPVAIWRNKRTKGTLLRCGVVAKNILSAVLRASLVHNRIQGNLNTNVTDDEKYFSEIGEQCCLLFFLKSPLFLFPVKIGNLPCLE